MNDKRLNGLKFVMGTMIFAVTILSIMTVMYISKYKLIGKTYAVQYKDVFNGTIDFKSVISPKYFSINGHYELNDYYPTSDGGWVYAGRPNYSAPTSEIYKYDKNGVLQWTKTFQIDGTVNAYIYKYTDGAKDNVIETYNSSATSGAAQIIETSDGNLAVSTRSAGVFAKLDSQGNILWQNESYWYKSLYEYDEVCTYDGNTNEQGQVLFSYDHGTKSYSDLNDNWKRDDTTYYCNRTYVTSYQFNTLGTRIAPLKNGNILSIASIYSNNYLSDDGVATPITSGMQLMVYDNDGNLQTIKNVREKVDAANTAYKAKYNISDSTTPTVQDYHWYLGSYGDNSVLLVMSETAIKLKYNEQTKDFETVWYTPLGYNGNQLESIYSNNDGILNIQLTDDGGFTFTSDYSSSPKETKKTTGLYSGSNLNIDVEVQPGYNHVRSGNYIYRFEERTESDGSKQAYLADAVQVMSQERDAYYTQAGANDFDVIYNYASDTRGITYAYMPDGSYIVASKMNWSYGGRGQNADAAHGIEEDPDFGKKINLADGSTYLIPLGTNEIVFRINKDHKVEWVKAYTGGITGMSDTTYIINKSKLSQDKKQLAVAVAMYPGSPLMEFKDASSAPETLYTRDTSSTLFHSFILYDLGYDQEVIPDPPTEPTEPSTDPTTESTTKGSVAPTPTTKKTTKKTKKGETTTTEETTTTTTTETTTTSTTTTTKKTTTTTQKEEVKGDETPKKDIKKIVLIAIGGLGGLFIVGIGFYFIPIIFFGKKKVLIGMSGNTDSAVAAKLLLDRNYKVSALFINNGMNVEGLTYAKQICNKLNIDLYEQDITGEYKAKIEEAKANPNADLESIYNKYILIDMLKEVAKEQKIKYISCGVYARKQSGAIVPGVNNVFDESSKLSLLTEEDIKKLVLPLGDIDYQEVHKIAEENFLNLSNKKQTPEEKIGM